MVLLAGNPTCPECRHSWAIHIQKISGPPEAPQMPPWGCIYCSCKLEPGELTAEERKKLGEPDPDFTFSDSALFYALEAVWQFLEKRGAKKTHYEKSVELRLTLRYLTYPNDGDPDETRMLRTTGDRKNSAWEIEEHGFFFEYEGGKVSCTTIPNPQKAREELFRYLLSLMAICGTQAEYQESVKGRKS